MRLARRNLSALVIFSGVSSFGPWSIFTNRAWRHCFALVPVWKPDGAETLFATRYWIKVEPVMWGISLDVWQGSEEEIARLQYAGGATAVLSVPIALPPRKLYGLRGVFSCVSILKAALGLHAWWIVSPWQLFRFLVRNRATLIPWSSDDGRTIRRITINGRP